MRYLVLSDIHSNIEALEACVRKGKHAGYDAVLCCGDIVDYGPNPFEVMDLLDEIGTVSIRGNHDRVVAGITEPEHFNPAARRSAEWTRQYLSEAYLERLAALPIGPLRVSERAQLVHGSERDEDEYVVTPGDAAINLALTSAEMTFFGHTHDPLVLTRGAHWMPSYDRDGIVKLAIPPGKTLINPGSVGQPRDGDPRASFLIWDQAKDVLEFYRADYSIQTTQAKMRAAGLPETLVIRLALGR